MKNRKKSTDVSPGETLHNMCRLLTLVFCTLRACDVITWKWYWVMLPLFVSGSIGIIALIIAGAIAVHIVSKKDDESGVSYG